MSVLLEQPASLVAYRPNKPTAMVVVADPRVRSTVTRHLWALGVRDVIEASSIAEARPRIGNPRDICVADVHLPDGSGLTLLSETRAAGWPNGLALSAADDIGAVRNALAGGVKGYVVTGTRTNIGLPTRPGAAPLGAGPGGESDIGTGAGDDIALDPAGQGVADRADVVGGGEGEPVGPARRAGLGEQGQAGAVGQVDVGDADVAGVADAGT
ncbi:response regulator, partial [Streptomyces misionensis]|uniref:response regulator n=1 Tax=Streptomyces misionensis TaxID=67331 RepID=UPI0037DA7195